jgi:formylglycine-generating enzyme required for sulfatase activity
MPTRILPKEKKSIRVYTQDLGDNIPLELVEIPAGTFTMGAPETEEGSLDEERPQHNVTLESFSYSVLRGGSWLNNPVNCRVLPVATSLMGAVAATTSSVFVFCV